MDRLSFGHECLCIVSCGLFAGVVDGAEPVRVTSAAIDIEYAVNENALPLDAVRLWYTLDRGATWQQSGLDEDRQSPITFHASQEGLHGFFLVARNPSGQSSPPPTQTTEPQQWAFIDYTPPVVQLHPLRQTAALGQRMLQIRWAAIDAHFDARPIELTYRRPPDTTWHLVAPEPLANTGQFDWRLPEAVSGPLVIRLTASDGGGHRVQVESDVFEITQIGHGAPGSSDLTDAPSSDGSFPDTGVSPLPGSPRAKERAARLFDEAIAHRQRGEYREGVARLREAVRLEPQRAEAFAEMADMLFRLGDLDRALNAYDLALRQQPTMRAALRGAAMVYRRKNDHAAAGRYLRTILRYNPSDAEVWMNLGDVAVFQGDELLARECYTRASQIDPDADQVIEDARKRLALMTESSRTPRQEGK